MARDKKSKKQGKTKDEEPNHSLLTGYGAVVPLLAVPAIVIVAVLTVVIVSETHWIEHATFGKTCKIQLGTIAAIFGLILQGAAFVWVYMAHNNSKDLDATPDFKSKKISLVLIFAAIFAYITSMILYGLLTRSVHDTSAASNAKCRNKEAATVQLVLAIGVVLNGWLAWSTWNMLSYFIFFGKERNLAKAEESREIVEHYDKADAPLELESVRVAKEDEEGGMHIPAQNALFMEQA